MSWVDACDVEDIDADDVLRFDRAGRTYAIYRTGNDAVFCSDGLCSHQQAHLAGGLLTGHTIECPKHNGCFDIRTGDPIRRPATLRLVTYPARVTNGRIWVDLPE